MRFLEGKGWEEICNIFHLSLTGASKRYRASLKNIILPKDAIEIDGQELI